VPNVSVGTKNPVLTESIRAYKTVHTTQGDTVMAIKKRIDNPFDDINIMPLMNIIMLLIPFLIMSAEFLTIGIINVDAPRINPGPVPPPPGPTEQQLNLTISVTQRGITLITRGDQISQGCDLSEEAMNSPHKQLPTIPKIDDKHDYIKFHECLSKIKKVFPNEQRAIIMAEPKIKYQTIVEILDYSREINRGKNDLFPKVVLSAGVI
jgi:biopolymer transport protein ExbD